MNNGHIYDQWTHFSFVRTQKFYSVKIKLKIKQFQQKTIQYININNPKNPLMRRVIVLVSVCRT